MLKMPITMTYTPIFYVMNQCFARILRKLRTSVGLDPQIVAFSDHPQNPYS
jgi:hypothetical protein